MESKLTTRSQEAITAAQRLAVDRGQAALEPLHLLVALLEQTDGIAGPLLRATGADPADVRAKADAALRRMPSVSGATVAAPSPRASCSGRSTPPASRPARWATSTCRPSTCWSASPRPTGRPGRSSPARVPPAT